MANCLGIYIENNLIKYAKVSKNHDDLKIESFGVRVFENLVNEIENIVEETYSFGVPISINLSSEQYVYFDIFALLNSRDAKKSIETEFENYCDEKNYNINAFETRYALVQNLQDKDQLKTIDIAMNKIELNKQIQRLGKNKVMNVVPLPMVIPNLNKFEKNENAIIINMEEKATITTIINSQIYQVDVLETGSRKVLENINKFENSYSKAYDICKNTTIYTADVANNDEQPYLQYMVPVLFEINQKLQEVLEQFQEKIPTVYLTGTLANINNVDLYFQEFLATSTCKILKPSFLEDLNTQVNMKDYIEVNSAISLALSGLGEGVKGMNFKKVSFIDKISKPIIIENDKKENTDKNKKEESKEKKIMNLDNLEMWLARGITAFLLILIIFIGFSAVLNKEMNSKEDQISTKLSEQEKQIKAIETDNSKLSSKTQKYKTLISELDAINEKISDINSSKNSIPNLLNQIMFIVPEAVQLTAISNTSGKQIEINAQSAKYEQLGYFIAKIKEKGYLKNAVSSSGAKSGGIVTVNIKGELP